MRYEKVLQKQRRRRRFRVRKSTRGSSARPRLSVHRTNKHVYCQLIDDETGKTVASASTRDKSVRDQLKATGNCDAATQIGKALAESALNSGIKQICFDRGRFKFHGRVAAVAEAAREAGLEF